MNRTAASNADGGVHHFAELPAVRAFEERCTSASVMLDAFYAARGEERPQYSRAEDASLQPERYVVTWRAVAAHTAGAVFDELMLAVVVVGLITAAIFVLSLVHT